MILHFSELHHLNPRQLRIKLHQNPGKSHQNPVNPMKISRKSIKIPSTPIENPSKSHFSSTIVHSKHPPGVKVSIKMVVSQNGWFKMVYEKSIYKWMMTEGTSHQNPTQIPWKSPRNPMKILQKSTIFRRQASLGVAGPRPQPSPRQSGTPPTRARRTAPPGGSSPWRGAPFDVGFPRWNSGGVPCENYSKTVNSHTFSMGTTMGKTMGKLWGMVTSMGYHLQLVSLKLGAMGIQSL